MAEICRAADCHFDIAETPGPLGQLSAMAGSKRCRGGFLVFALVFSALNTVGDFAQRPTKINFVSMR